MPRMSFLKTPYSKSFAFLTSISLHHHHHLVSSPLARGVLSYSTRESCVLMDCLCKFKLDSNVTTAGAQCELLESSLDARNQMLGVMLLTPNPLEQSAATVTEHTLIQNLLPTRGANPERQDNATYSHTERHNHEAFPKGTDGVIKGHRKAVGHITFAKVSRVWK